MSEQRKKGLLRDGGNFIVHNNKMQIQLDKNGKAKIISDLELVKVTDFEDEDFWAVVEKPSVTNNSTYDNFEASITEKQNGKEITRLLTSDRRPTPEDPNVFEHYVSFERCINKNENITFTYSYDRPIKEIITEKGLFFRNRVVLYVNSFSIPCDNLTVEIIPAKRFLKKEIKKFFHCENIHSNEDHFYTESFAKHREYVIQQFLSWRVLPPYLERFTWSLLTTIGTTIFGIIITILYYDEIKAFIDYYF